MLYISILLSVWFCLWLIHTKIIKDTCEIFVEQIDENYEEEDIDPLLEKAENGGVYHLNCDHCHHLWWSIEPTVNYCPNCGKKPHE